MKYVQSVRETIQRFKQHVQDDTDKVDNILFLEVLLMEVREGVSLFLTPLIGRNKEALKRSHYWKI